MLPTTAHTVGTDMSMGNIMSGGPTNMIDDIEQARLTGCWSVFVFAALFVIILLITCILSIAFIGVR